MIIGNPSPWRARFNQLEKKFSERIKKIWPDCSVLVHSDSQENRITNILVHSLQKDKIARKLGLIVPQYTLLEEEQIGDVVTKGIIDFAVFIHKDHERYIAFECKRLNVSFTSGKKSLALDYVNEGMMRYISAQYAKNLPLGVMLGYVMDGDLDKAHENIKNSIRKKNTELQCLDESSFEEMIATDNHLYFVSEHMVGSSRFSIKHSLLPIIRC